VKRLDLAGTGSMVVDRLCETPRMVGPDEKVLLRPDPEGGVVRQLVGGVTLNHLGWARLFGLRTGIFGKQADDADGRFLRRGMAGLGIETSLDLSGGASSFAQVYVGPDGGRAIYMARGATGELTPAEIDAHHAHMIADAQIVTTEVSQLQLDTVFRVLSLARQNGAVGVLDIDVPLRDAVPGLGSEAQLHEALETASVLKASISSLDGIVDASDPADVAKQLERRYSPDAVVLTLGSRGAAVFADGRLSLVPGAASRVVDTTGAGDAFLGGLLAARSLGLDWELAARLGNACGAVCCERHGGFPDDPEACRSRALELYTSLGGAPLELPPLESAGEAALEHFLRTAGDELLRARGALDRAALREAARHIRAVEAGAGRVHVTGVGKPEHLAHYAASLLSSTGTPAVFLHATEATHGGIGQLREGDVVVAISNSGETAELLAAVEAVRAFGATVVGVTADANSSLGRVSDCVLEMSVVDEAGPLGLAPRTSFLVAALTLQALSVELQAGTAFCSDDYFARHPAGVLGERARRS
jgi:arabinose-5-phosphate isomerase